MVEVSAGLSVIKIEREWTDLLKDKESKKELLFSWKGIWWLILLSDLTGPGTN